MNIDIRHDEQRGRVFTALEEVRFGSLIVPVGFECDGASVPRIFWGIIFPPADERAMRGAFVHDYIYATHPDFWSREDADDAFLYLLKHEGVPSWRATLAYLAVRLFGGKHWRKKKC